MFERCAGGFSGIRAVPFDYLNSPRQTGRIQMPWMSQNVAFLSSAAGAFRAWDSDRGRSGIRQIRHLKKGLRAWKTKRDQGGRWEFKNIQGFWFFGFTHGKTPETKCAGERFAVQTLTDFDAGAAEGGARSMAPPHSVELKAAVLTALGTQCGKPSKT